MLEIYNVSVHIRFIELNMYSTVGAIHGIIRLQFVLGPKCEVNSGNDLFQ